MAILSRDGFSKHLVDGGKILVESRYGEGSTFIFFIPIEPITSGTREHPPENAKMVKIAGKDI